MSQEDVNAIILSPRQVATGDPAGNALENINTNVLGDGALCYVQQGDGQGEWQLSKSSILAANGTSVVAPTAGPGRWVLKSGPGPSESFFGGVNWDLWVDNGSAGNDNNPGTEEAPFATISKAFATMGNNISGNAVVHLINSGAGFSLAGIQWPSNVTGNLAIYGEDGWEQIWPAVAVTTQTGFVLDCTAAAPGWTVDALVAGNFAEMIDSVGNVTGYVSIVANTASTITLGHTKGASLTGGSVRVVRAAAKINPGVYPAGVLYGGTNRVLYTPGSSAGVPASGVVHWFRVQLAENTMFPIAIGCHNFVQTSMVSSGTSRLYVSAASTIFSGTPYAIPGTSLTTADSEGCGLTCVSTAAGTFGLTIEPAGSFFGTLTTDDAAIVIGGFGNFYRGFRVGNLGVAFGGICRLGTPGKVYAQSFTAQSLAHCEIVSDVTFFGTGAASFLLSYRNAYIYLQATVAVIGTAPTLTAYDGGSIELAAFDYAAFGAATIGRAPMPTLTRPAGAWVAGQSVATQAVLFTQLPTDGGSAIFRSA